MFRYLKKNITQIALKAVNAENMWNLLNLCPITTSRGFMFQCGVSITYKVCTNRAFDIEHDLRSVIDQNNVDEGHCQKRFTHV